MQQVGFIYSIIHDTRKAELMENMPSYESLLFNV